MQVLKDCTVPRWVGELVAGAHSTGWSERTASHAELDVVHRQTPEAGIATVTVRDAGQMSVSQLRAATCRAYQIHRKLTGDARHPIRVWNFIPGITEPMPCGLDRYMAFNLGRHDAVEEWFGPEISRSDRLPTATGVGHHDSDLSIHVLSSSGAPMSIENPRQRPAYRYTSRFGPKPPCFSRASLVRHGDRSRLLIAGTASIQGEQSLHADRISEQLTETFENLRALVGSVISSEHNPLTRLRNVRAYSPKAEHDSPIHAELTARLGGHPFELIRADLCRPELLVEIEGTAWVEPRNGDNGARTS